MRKFQILATYSFFMNKSQPSPAYLMKSFNTLATNGREYHVQGKFKSIEWIWLELRSEE